MRWRIPYWPLLLGPILAFVLGVTLNVTVTARNGGVMPYLTADCQPDPGDSLHVCETPSTHWKFLTDWITFPRDGVYSPGDMLVFVWYDLRYYFWLAWAILMIKRDTRLG